MRILFALSELVIIIALTNKAAAISSGCLACMCEATTKCDLEIFCPSTRCGPFQIEKIIWTRGNQPVQSKELPNSVTAFTNCVNELKCAARTMIDYIQSREKEKVLDYNKDGEITCLEDIAHIYYIGQVFRDYKNKPPLKEKYAKILQMCLTHLGEQ